MTNWRAMTPDDLPSVLGVADTVHTDYPEEIEVFADRLTLFPSGCRVAVDTLAGAETRVVGYFIAHPAKMGDPPSLNTRLGRLDTGADCLYLHDIALLAEARGRGLPGLALTWLERLAVAQGYQRLALTATPGAYAYWRALGFVEHASTAAEGGVLTAKLSSYGDGMVHMWRPAGETGCSP